MEIKIPFESNSFKANDYEAEQNFRETCLWFESKFCIPDQPSSEIYQKYINNYHKAKSLYIFAQGETNSTKLFVYDTENEREEIKILKSPIDLNCYAQILLLPNGELFCSYQDKALLIDSNYEVRLLPSGLPLSNSSAIYFNSCIYCFGGVDLRWNYTTFSRKFDLNENRWIDLSSLPKGDFYCHSVIFNRNILICGYNSGNLLLYSVEIDSFSKIPYEFFNRRRKNLINAERLYLIECFGFIYESEVENEYAWEKISHSSIQNNCPNQIYCLYNKCKIYIIVESPEEKYFKFDLKHRIIDKSC